jgi:hypothetical protein
VLLQGLQVLLLLQGVQEVSGEPINDVRNSCVPGAVRYADAPHRPEDVPGHVWVKEDDPGAGYYEPGWWRWALYKMEEV